MDLRPGKWKINGNGFTGEIDITSVAADGQIAGTVFGNQILGFWDDVSKKITFLRVINPADPSTHQVYTGYLFRTPGASPLDAIGDFHLTLTGCFEAFSGTGGIAQRVLYGWYAMLGVIG